MKPIKNRKFTTKRKSCTECTKFFSPEKEGSLTIVASNSLEKGVILKALLCSGPCAISWINKYGLAMSQYKGNSNEK